MPPTAPYGPAKKPPPETPEQLRARIPGWGVDADPRDRPSVPREQPGFATGAHWEVPDLQTLDRPRERSVEHERLTPVFGTVAPTRGLSGVVRRYSYRRFSEGRAAHWLLLVAADRVDVLESRVLAALRGRPDNPLTETGIRAELTHDGWSSRTGRVDVRHQVLDPVVAVGPSLLAGATAVAVAVAVRRRRRRSVY